ncbi:methyl-accepting chemotaxis protein [Tropicimonas aquimaris]|uniref:Methyl-accepting chemotaxis protein n=1 Tax=Tropicimonas aquimaris TaxID=914152 RepID=A0ABW3IL40_9RHOB
MLRSLLSRLSTRIYGIVALAALLIFVLAEVLLSMAVDSAFEMRQQHLSDVVETATNLLDNYAAHFERGELTLEEAQAEAREALSLATYGTDGYFFAFTPDTEILVLPAKPEWVGTNQADYEDAKGLKLYQALRDVALKEGAGSVTYHFIRPDTTVPEEKIGFVVHYDTWNWIVGTGSYVSDIHTTLSGLRTFSLIAMAVSIVAMVGVSTLLVRSVTRPLAALIGRMRGLKEGDVETPVPLIDARSEVGDMARSIDVFRTALVERTRLEAEQAAKDKELARQREAALEQESLMQKREAEAATHRQQEEARQAAEREAQRAEAEAERERVRAEQELVVSSLAQSLNAMSQGDLSTRLTQTFPPAYEALRKDFNNAVERVSELVGSIVEGAGHIKSETSSLNAAAVELGRRTESQAASLEQTAAAVTELTSSLESSTHGAREAAGTVSRTRDRSRAGKEVVHRTIDAMTEISESSGRISKITGVIDDIAFQTNLLALNAGVEAARAGDAGRGFAVVASEVRALAQRSSEAAREIAQLIATSGHQVETGVQLVNESGTSLEEIEKLVAQLDELVSDIAESSAQQATGLNEISSAMNQLDQVTQQNAAMFEETNAAVSALQAQATALERDSASFTLARQETDALRIAS